MTYIIGQRVEVRSANGQHWLPGRFIRYDDSNACWVQLEANYAEFLFGSKDVRPHIEEHPDSKAVDVFAKAMKEKLYEARLKGRGGWEKPEECTTDLLAKMLMQHTTKGDPVDIANFAMMLFMRRVSRNTLEFAARDFQESIATDLREELEDIKQLCIEAGCTDPAGEYAVPAITFVEELRQRTVCKTPYHYIDDVSPENIEKFLALCEDHGVTTALDRNTKLVWDALARNPPGEEDPM